MSLGFRYILLVALLAVCPVAIGDEGDPVRLVITGNLHGYIKACKCPDGQPGGLARRKTVFDQIRAETPDAVFIDCGRTLNYDVSESEIDLLHRLYYELEYDIICPYIIDLAKLQNSWTNIDSLPLSFMISNLLEVYYTDLRSVLTPIHPLGIKSVEILDTKPLLLTVSDTYVTDESDPEGRWNQEYLDSDTYRYQLMQRGDEAFMKEAVDFPGLFLTVQNVVDPEDQEASDSMRSIIKYKNQAGLDFIIIGGGGYTQSRVAIEDDVLTAYPGLFGSHVLVVDLWTEDGRSVSHYEWEAIPTESVLPDSAFQTRVDEFYERVEEE